MHIFFRNRILAGAAPLFLSVLLLNAAAEPPAPAGASAFANARSTAMRTRATSTTALTVASAATATGNAITLLATVDGKAGPAPKGLVVFTVQGKRIGEVPVANGAASLTVSALPAGLSSLSASYRGDGNFLPSKSATIRFYQDDQD